MQVTSGELETILLVYVVKYKFLFTDTGKISFTGWNLYENFSSKVLAKSG